MADLRLEQAQGKVDYTVGAEYRREQGVNGKGNMVGFFMSVPLPFSNRNQGEIARADAEREKAARSVRAGETSVAGEVAAAYQEFESARSLLADIEHDLLAPTREARNSVAYVYQAGATSLLDVLDAQRAFNDTMDTYYSAQAAYRRAQARLSLTVNKDSSHDHQNHPRALQRHRCWRAAARGAPADDVPATAAPPDSANNAPSAVRLSGPQLQQIHVEVVSATAPDDAIRTTGVVEFNADRMARILPPVSGQVHDLAIKVGDTVAKDAVLFVLSSREVAAAIAEHRASHKDLDLAEKTYAMTQDLFEHQAASRIAQQQAENELAKAKARVTQTEEVLQVLGLDSHPRRRGRPPASRACRSARPLRAP